MKIDLEKLRKQIAKNKMTCTTLASKAGITKAALSRLMNKKTSPRPDTIGKLAEALNCEIEDITE